MADRDTFHIKTVTEIVARNDAMDHKYVGDIQISHEHGLQLYPGARSRVRKLRGFTRGAVAVFYGEGAGLYGMGSGFYGQE